MEALCVTQIPHGSFEHNHPIPSKDTTTSMFVTRASDFDPDQVQVGAARERPGGGKTVPLLYSNGSRLRLQTPIMPAVFGVSSYEERGVVKSYSLALSFRDIDRDEISEFQRKLETLDELLIKTAVEQSEQFFGKALSQEEVSGMYRRILGHPNRAYPPLIKLKIDVEKTGLPTAQFYDENRNLTTVDHVGKGDMAKVIAGLGNIWFMNGKFGATFNAQQVQTVKTVKTVQGTRIPASADRLDPSIGQLFL